MITFEKTIHNFGTATIGDKLVAHFKYTGDEDLKVTDITTNCSCTSKSYNPVTKVVDLELRNDTVGFRQSTATVGPVTLILQANIIDKK